MSFWKEIEPGEPSDPARELHIAFNCLTMFAPEEANALIETLKERAGFRQEFEGYTCPSQFPEEFYGEIRDTLNSSLSRFGM